MRVTILCLALGSLAFLPQQQGFSKFQSDVSGNFSLSDYFKAESYPTLLYQTSDYLYIGYRDGFLIWSKPQNRPVMQKILTAGHDSQERCKVLFSEKESLCKNYINVYVEDEETQSFWLCGTNAFQPTCWKFDQYSEPVTIFGEGITKFSPEDRFCYLALPGNVTTVISGTYADLRQTDPLIYGRVLDSTTGIRTRPSYFIALNEPQFMNSFLSGKYAFFIIKEIPTLTEEHFSVGTPSFARIARVCQNDQGSAWARDRWTSFVKVPLHCNHRSSPKFAYTQLEASTGPLWLNGRKMFFAIFSETQRDGTQIFALCGYSLEDVDKSFASKQFRIEMGTHSDLAPSYSSINSILDKCISVQDPTTVEFLAHNPLITYPVESIFDPIQLYYSIKTAPSSLLALSHFKDYDVNVIIGMHSGHYMQLNLELNSWRLKLEKIQHISENSIISINSITNAYILDDANTTDQSTFSTSLDDIMITTKSELLFVSSSSVAKSCTSHYNCYDCLASNNGEYGCIWIVKSSSCHYAELPINFDKVIKQNASEICIAFSRINVGDENIFHESDPQGNIPMKIAESSIGKQSSKAPATFETTDKVPSWFTPVVIITIILLVLSAIAITVILIRCCCSILNNQKSFKIHRVEHQDIEISSLASPNMLAQQGPSEAGFELVCQDDLQGKTSDMPNISTKTNSSDADTLIDPQTLAEFREIEADDSKTVQSEALSRHFSESLTESKIQSRNPETKDPNLEIDSENIIDKSLTLSEDSRETINYHSQTSDSNIIDQSCERESVTDINELLYSENPIESEQESDFNSTMSSYKTTYSTIPPINIKSSASSEENTTEKLLQNLSEQKLPETASEPHSSKAKVPRKFSFKKLNPFANRSSSKTKEQISDRKDRKKDKKPTKTSPRDRKVSISDDLTFHILEAYSNNGDTNDSRSTDYSNSSTSIIDSAIGSSTTSSPSIKTVFPDIPSPSTPSTLIGTPSPSTTTPTSAIQDVSTDVSTDNSETSTGTIVRPKSRIADNRGSELFVSAES